MASRTLFLLTDFGAGGYHQGILKAVVARLAPEVRIEDLGHGIPRGAVADGAFVLGLAWPSLPEGAVVVAVVDPGVGGTRRELVVSCEGRLLVAPDNGLVTALWHRGRAVARAFARQGIEPGSLSRTFHGRDLFAPLGARLASGLRFEDVGPTIEDPVLLDGWKPDVGTDGVRGRILHLDPFGNAVTNIGLVDLQGERQGWSVVAGALSLSAIVGTYGDVPPGAPLAYLGSAGLLEIGVRDGRADRELGLAVGAPVLCRRDGAR